MAMGDMARLAGSGLVVPRDLVGEQSVAHMSPERLRRIREPLRQRAVEGQDHGRVELYTRDRLFAAQRAVGDNPAKHSGETEEAGAVVLPPIARAPRIRSRLLTSSRDSSAAAVDFSQLSADIDLPQKPRSDAAQLLRHLLGFLDLREQSTKLSSKSSSGVMRCLLEALGKQKRERRPHLHSPVHPQFCDPPLDGCR